MLVDAGADEGGRDDERVDGTGAEGLHVGAGGVHTAGLLGHGFAEVAAAALIPVAHCFLPTADGIGEVFGREAGTAEEMLQRERACRLAREVLEEHPGGETLVEVVRPVHDPGAASVAIERERSVGSLAAVQVEELKLVGGLHPGIEGVLVDEDPEGALCGRLDRALPPGALDFPKGVRPEVPDEDLMRRVAERVVEGSERRLDLVGGILARGLRAVADEVGRVR
jgi:hypothetical protein